MKPTHTSLSKNRRARLRPLFRIREQYLNDDGIECYTIEIITNQRRKLSW